MPIIFVALIPILVVMLVVAIALRRVVPTNMVHIVQSKKATTSYGKGRTAGNVYYQWPAWLPGLGVTVTEFPESVFDVPLKSYESYDVGRLPFHVDVMAFFRIADSDVAAHRVAHFGELQAQLTFILQGAVRSILAQEKLEQIMQDRKNLGIRFTEEVEAQLREEWGVQTVRTIEFMDIRDAPGSVVIQQIMAKDQARIEKESRTAVALNKQQAQEAEIDAARQVDLRKQEAVQQVGERTAAQARAVGIAQQLATQEVLTQQKETATREMDVKLVKDVRAAEIARNVATIQAEQQKAVAVVEADGHKQALVITAEADKERVTLVSQGALAAAQNDAQGTLAVGTSRAEAERLMLLAPVSAQTTLADKIGANQPYQDYLVRLRQVEASQAVGVQVAQALGEADIKIIANSGDIQSGMTSVGDMFTSKFGTTLTGLMTALSQTPAGQALVERVTGTGGTTATSSDEPAATTPPPAAKGGATRNGRPA